MALKNKKYFILFILPAAAFITVFLLYPLVRTFYYSLTSWRNFSVKQTFIGLENYQRLLTDPVIGIAIRNTFIMMVGVFIFQIGVALLLAILVSNTKRMFKLLRTTYFIPILISATAIGLMFKLIYGYEYGLLNLLLGFFGVDKQVWLNENTSIFLVTIPIMWQYVGFYFVIFLTGMSNISPDIYESAELDGITPFQKAIYITIPMMRDVLASSVVLVISGCFKVFDMVYVITNGGPMNSSQLLSTYMYSMAFEKYNGGYASAIAVIMILLGILVTVVLRRITEVRED